MQTEIIADIEHWRYVSDVKKARSRPTNLLVLATLAALVIVALLWQYFAFISAAANFASRPALLRDAEVGSPVVAFRDRFSAGTSEAELRIWLSDNAFEVDASDAIRRIPSMPCQELVEVSWTAVDGIIMESKAVVREAGCF